MLRISASTRIAVALAGLTLGLLCAAQALGLIPDTTRSVMDRRKSLCEAIAVQACMAVQQDDLTTLKSLTTALLERNHDVLAVKVRRSVGRQLIAVGDAQLLDAKSDNQSPPADLAEVPILKQGRRWGTVQIYFKTLRSDWLVSWLPPPWPLIVLATLLTFVSARLYLRRILQHLDPSAVIPDRVRATLDTLAEGVLVLDKNERIVLANQAFAEKVGQSSTDLQGSRDRHWLGQIRTVKRERRIRGSWR